MSKPNQRREDGEVAALACSVCDNNFSKFGENDFSAKLFLPFVSNLASNKVSNTYNYETWLLYFAISMAWRAAAVRLDEIRKHNPQHALQTEKAMRRWQGYLLRKHNEIHPYEHHLVFHTYFENGAYATGANRVLWRGATAGVYERENSLCAFARLPGMTFWSPINPTKANGFSGTKIDQRGRMGPQVISNEMFDSFLHQQIKVMSNLNYSEKQKVKISETTEEHLSKLTDDQRAAALIPYLLDEEISKRRTFPGMHWLTDEILEQSENDLE